MGDRIDKPEVLDGVEFTKSDKPLPPLGWWKEEGLGAAELFRRIAEMGMLSYDREDLTLTHDVYDDKGDLIGELARFDAIMPSHLHHRRVKQPVGILGLLSIGGQRAVYELIPGAWTVKPKE